MKITSYFCDLCGSAIPTELVDEVKGLNIRVDLDHGAYESFVFQHRRPRACGGPFAWRWVSAEEWSVEQLLPPWRQRSRGTAQRLSREYRHLTRLIGFR